MQCSELQNLAGLYLDDGLPEETCLKIDRHVMRCETCSFELRSMEQTRGVLREAFIRESTTPGFRERLSARLQVEFEDVLVHPSDTHPTQLELPYVRLPLE